MSVAKKVIVAGTGVVAGVAALGTVTGRRWKHNPDPLNGEEPRFPEGEELMVPVDDGAELRVVRAGHGPTVVLVHGLTSNSDDWGPISRRLVEAGHHVIAVNQRGHGGSTVGSDGYGAPRLGRDLRQVLAALDVRGAVLAGHSMGGMAALTFAIDHPEEMARRINGMCLISTLGSTADAGNQVGLRVVAGRPSSALGGHNAAADHLRRRFGRAVFGRRPNWNAIGHAITTALRCPDETRVAAAKGLLDYDVSEQLGSIRTPVTVICGTFDVVTYHRYNVELAEAIPNARMVSLPDVGHMSIWEAAAEIADEIRSLVPADANVD